MGAQQKNLDQSSSVKQNRVGAVGRMKGKLDIKGCFKKSLDVRGNGSKRGIKSNH